MENRAVFLEQSAETAVNGKDTPEFYRLYQRAVLLELKEQGFFSEVQYRFCVEQLEREQRAKELSGSAMWDCFDAERWGAK